MQTTGSVCTGAEIIQGLKATGVPDQHRQLPKKAYKLLKAVYMMWNEQHVHGSCQWFAHDGARSGQAQAKSLYSGANNLQQGAGRRRSGGEGACQHFGRLVAGPHMGLVCVGARDSLTGLSVQLLHSNHRVDPTFGSHTAGRCREAQRLQHRLRTGATRQQHS